MADVKPTNVRVRYFHVTKGKEAQPNCIEALDHVAGIDLKGRERTIGELDYRMEHCEHTRNGTVSGDFTRIQRQNRPAEVYDDGVGPLSIEHPLGSSVAFCFDPNLHVLALQHDVHIMSPSKIRKYLVQFNDTFRYSLDLIVSAGAWDEFEEGIVRKFKVKVALPNSFEFLVDDDPIIRSIPTMAEAYQSPYVTIELGLGNRKGHLSDRVKRLAQRVMNDADVRSLRASVVGDPDEINLMQHIEKDEQEMELDDGDPDGSYTRRVRFVQQCLEKHRASFLQQFGT